MSAAISVEVPLEEAQRLADLTGIRADLRVCRQACERYLNLLQSSNKGHEYLFMSQVLVTTAFTKYGRCFKGGVRVKTEKEILNQLDDEGLKTHQLVIDIRDKHVSHSVNEFEHHRASVWLSHESPDRKVTNVSIGTTYITAPDPFVFQNWILLIDKIDKWLHAETLTESNRLTEIVKDRFTLDELYDRVGQGKPHEVEFKDVARTRKGT